MNLSPADRHALLLGRAIMRAETLQYALEQQAEEIADIKAKLDAALPDEDHAPDAEET